MVSDSLLTSEDLEWVEVTDYFSNGFRAIRRGFGRYPFTRIYTYRLDRRGRIVEETETDENGTVLRIERSVYRSRRIVERRTQRFSDGMLQLTQITQYE